MGIKIHKALGYGAFHPDHHGLFEKLDDEGVKGEVDQLMNADIIRNVSSFNPLFCETEAVVLDICRLPYPGTFLDCVHFTEHTDAKDGNVLIIPPSRYHDWIRRDDSIDYYDKVDVYTHIKILNTPINGYPGWMDAETGELKISDYEYDSMCCRNLVPMVPVCVRLIAEKIGMDWKMLKPMTATWWR